MERTRPLSRWRRRYMQARDNYFVVFGLILLVIALTVFISATGAGALLITIVQTLALLMTLHNAKVRGRSLTLARAVALIPIVSVAAALVLQRPVGTTYFLSMMLLIVGTQIAIIVHAVREGTITVDTVTGALCVYLLLGLLFATFAAFYADSVGPFFAQQGTHPPGDYVYFSFITIETVGYGDLTPGAPLPRVLAFMEGLIGQLYLVTVIAVLVSNIVPSRVKKTPEQSGKD